MPALVRGEPTQGRRGPVEEGVEARRILMQLHLRAVHELHHQRQCVRRRKGAGLRDETLHVHPARRGGTLAAAPEREPGGHHHDPTTIFHIDRGQPLAKPGRTRACASEASSTTEAIASYDTTTRNRSCGSPSVPPNSGRWCARSAFTRYASSVTRPSLTSRTERTRYAWPVSVTTSTTGLPPVAFTSCGRLFLK